MHLGEKRVAGRGGLDRRRSRSRRRGEPVLDQGHGERSRLQLLFKLAGTGTRLILRWLFIESSLAVHKCLIDTIWFLKVSC